MKKKYLSLDGQAVRLYKAILLDPKLVLDRRKKLRTRADVYTTVKTVLDDG